MIKGWRLRILPALAGIISPAMAVAADMPIKAPIAPPAVAAPVWAGFYLGANAGYGWSEGNSLDVQETLIGAPFFFANFGTLNSSGGFGGGQIGYNFQTGNLVLGVEADIEGSGIRSRSVATTVPYLAPGNTMTVASSQRLDWFGTVRGRIGWAWKNLLLYGTGGFAFGQVRSALVMTDTFNFSAASSLSSDRSGYVVGAGGEYMFAPKWSAKLEYQYIHLGAFNATTPEVFGAGLPSAFALTTPIRENFHTVRVGVNYHF